jgi:hypothetical protein
MFLMALTWISLPTAAVAQDSAPDPAPQAPVPMPAEHQHAMPAPAVTAYSPREASGTSWLPDETPMYGIHRQGAPWQTMWHGNGFAQYLHDAGDRGQEQAGSINWLMGMARRDAGGGRFGLRGMISLEPATIGGCGYPDLLATGEICEGGAIYDRQHPHDFVMEAAAEYERPLGDSLRWQLYGGLAGEPALGPVAYPHRISAMPNPLAPISHHWLDATHITFGVVTTGVFGATWKADVSVFNGREPDEDRWNLDLAALDSMSGRFSFAPTPSIVLEISAGHLNDAEAGEDGGPRVDVGRVTASAIYHRRLPTGTLWATTAAWGRNTEEGEASQAFLVETSLTVSGRNGWYGRFEAASKAAHDLGLHGTDESFAIAKLQAGYTRYFDAWRSLQPGFGGSISVGFVPDPLESAYGRRVNPGFGIFLTLRPAAHGM